MSFIYFKQSLSSALFRVLCLCVFMLSGLGIVLFSPIGVLTTSTIPEEIHVVIPQGARLESIGNILAEQGIVPTPVSFYLAAVLSQTKGKLKAGEFAFKGDITPIDVAKIIAYGKSIKRFITIPEGSSVKYVMQLINSNSVLTGAITAVPKEGFLMPETYAYVYGENRQVILNRMTQAMDAYLAQVNLSDHPTIKSYDQLLTLASLVEKETALKHERAEVAGVYLNRLKINMPLQCDPTVIYGIMFGDKLDRPLTRADLETYSPYNTYRVKGLPPGAIACPGKASIEAVLNPAITQALYFVADGKGGHSFSSSLNDHNKNVQVYRSCQKKAVANPPSVVPVSKKKKCRRGRNR